MVATELLCTVGPTLNTPEQIATLIKEGVHLIRVNFSHGSPEDHKKFIQIIRDGSKLANKPVKIMGDIQGPKFRVGAIKLPGVELKEGQTFTLDMNEKEGDETRCFLPHPEFYKTAEEGDFISLNDGLIGLKVISCTENQIKTRVICGGELSSRKGISMPNKVIRTVFPTPKDLVSIETALTSKVDALMLSFVQCKEDVAAVRKLTGDNLHLMSKIETPAAVKNIKEIVSLSDSILIARGDLGVEAQMHNVPEIQNNLINFCHETNTKCYAATQFLESMVKELKPSRAEVQDIYATVQAGVNGILLTGETANGVDPLNTMKWLKNIVEKAEKDKEQ